MRQVYVRPRACAIAVLGLWVALAGVALAQTTPQPSTEPQTQTQTPPARICVIVPHFKDEYWLSVGYGLQQAADAAGAELLIHESGGYHGRDQQVALLGACQRRQTDAVLIGAVSPDDPRLLAAIAETRRDQPVLALVNALNAPDLAGWIGVDWQDMGRAVGSYLSARHPAGGPVARAVLVGGLAESGAGPVLLRGLNEGIEAGAIDIVGIYRADTGVREQLRQVERALADHPQVDYLIGSAPAIEGAMALLRRLPDTAPRPQLIAYYISHSVLRGLKNGQVAMVPYDDPIAQGRLGLERALRAAQGEIFPGLSGPKILPITAETGNIGAVALSPAGFIPTLE